MPVINEQENIRYWTRPDPKIENLPPDFTLVDWLNTIIDDSENYFYLRTGDGELFDHFALEDIVPSDVLTALKKGEITLLIVNMMHGHHCFVDNIYRHVVVKHDINPKNILFAAESYDLPKEIELVSQKYNKDTIRYKWTIEFEYLFKNRLSNYNNTLEKKKYEKKFLCFNGLARPHRDSIVFLLNCLGIIDQGYVSYNAYEGGTGYGEPAYNLVYPALQHNDEIKKLLEDRKDELLEIKPMYIDGPSNPNYTALNLGEETFYDNTLFSVVTESNFSEITFWGRTHKPAFTDVGRLLSEKTFKPIKARHPFITVSNAKTLELIRSIGYKTFHPFIDESYDQIEDDASRLLAIAKEVKRLCEMNEQEIYEFIDNVLPICEYNQQLLNSKTKFHYNLI